MSRQLSALALALILPLGCLGCSASVEQLTAAAGMLGDQVAAIQRDIDTSTDPQVKARLQAKVDAVAPLVQRLAAETAKAQTAADFWWSLAEGIATALGVLAVPGAGIAAVALRSARRIVTPILAAVQAGGGPKDPAAAKAVLSTHPAAYAVFADWKAEAAKLVASAAAPA